MPRRFVKDDEGANLRVPQEREALAFQVAQTITQALGMEAVITRVRDPETGNAALGLYINSGKKDIAPHEMELARKLWREFFGGERRGADDE